MRFLLSLAAGFVLLASSSAARADLMPDGMTHVPVEVTIDNQNALADQSIVLVGCSDAGGGRHSFDIAKPGTASRCSIKMGITVYAVPTKDVKPLEELRTKDVGWAEEGMQAKKLLEKATTCGDIKESSLVETAKHITFLSARYSLEKTPTGCSIKKVGETVPTTSSSGAPSASASASSAPAPSSSTSATPPVKASGCGACTTIESSKNKTTTTAAGVGFSLLGLALVAARRRRR